MTPCNSDDLSLGDYDIQKYLDSSNDLQDSEFQKAVDDFDLTLLDDPVTFDPPVKKIHPESEEIRRIMGPPPFEYLQNPILNSPSYMSPLHLPESPTYPLLSPTGNPPYIDNCIPTEPCSPLPLSDEVVKTSQPINDKKIKDRRKANKNVKVPQGWTSSQTASRKRIPIPGRAVTNSYVLNRKKSTQRDRSKRRFTTSLLNMARCQKPKKSVRPSADEIQELATAFKSRLKTYIIRNIRNIKDPRIFMNVYKHIVVDKLQAHVKQSNLKVNMLLHAEYKRVVREQEIVQVMNFKTKNEILLSSSNITKYYTQSYRKILAEMEGFQEAGSQWTLKRIQSLEIRLNRYVPLRGSSYLPLPEKIESKKAVINIKNTDEKCFLWSILAAVHPAKDHVDRLSNYLPFCHEFDEALDGIEFPVNIEHIDKFETRSNISVNVYSYDEKYVVYPLRVTSRERETHVDLLYVTNKTSKHYCYIKNLSRLVSSQLTKKEHKKWLCRQCLLNFGTEELLLKHKEDCNTHEAVKIVLPSAEEKLSFKDFQCSMKVPFVIYADFECILCPVATCNPSADQPYTNTYQKHEVASFSYYITYANGNYKPPVTYFGSDAAAKFVQMMEKESADINKLYSIYSIVPMIPLTKQEKELVLNTTLCHICNQPLNGDSVLDHDHLTGKFRGVAHNKCNLHYRKPKFIPVFIHNLSGYDTHLFIKMFGMNNETINVIPNNEERYISYTVKKYPMIELRFLDSFKFMASGLDKLVKNLTSEQFHHTTKFFADKQLELILRKGVYPYDYMDTFEKYDEKSLPDQAAFYNRLNKCSISDEDYKHAQSVWETFNIRDMKEYTLLYNKTDVLLLADVMENFRDVCLATYKLDPAWYFTAPGLAWSAMLKTTNIVLDLLTDYDMIMMVEKGIRGGISQCSNRHARANNPYMKEYDSTKPTTYLTYLDANNLYGWAMSQHMPYKDFKWCDTTVDVTTVPDDADTGYILEVDLEYPKEIHDLHSDLPVAPESRIAPGSKESKLLTTLFDKDKYVLHYRNLKLYLSLGVRLKKIHRVISFAQKDWLRSYIDLNTNMRTQAKNDFEKDFFKLMNNSVFGKTMENIRNRVDIRLATMEKQIDKWVAQPNFKGRTIFTENLAAVHFSKTKLKFNKPIYVGMSILDVSKILMYNFHYNVIKARYGDNARLQYTDTDSLTYSIATADFYNDMKDMINYFDTSDYPQQNPYDMPRVNKKVLGKMKDELNGHIMREFVGLRSKMYANDIEGGLSSKKSKGVKKSVVANEITFEDYKNCLFSKKEQYKSMNMIRSYNHNLYSIELHKIVLSTKDDKRCILEDGITSLPWGHYRIGSV